MARNTDTMLRRLPALMLLGGLLAAHGAAAQSVAATAPTEQGHTYSGAELEQLVGPIALYVDDLIGIVLPASAYPLQVVEAARFLDARQNDPTLEPDADWDDSIVALLNYPDVLRMMSENLDWTADLGEAFVYQQPDVLDAIQRFRERARSAGNLSSDGHQVVSQDAGAIEIAPANPAVIYVPYYEPESVVVYHSAPVIHYYPYAYPLYDYPYPFGYSFNSGFFWGVTTAFVIGWQTHNLHVYGYDYVRHPFYGHRYYDPFYVRRAVRVGVTIEHHYANAWRPNAQWGARPRHRIESRSVAGYAGHDRRVAQSPARSAPTFSPVPTNRNRASYANRGSSTSPSGGTVGRVIRRADNIGVNGERSRAANRPIPEHSAAISRGTGSMSSSTRLSSSNPASSPLNRVRTETRRSGGVSIGRSLGESQPNSAYRANTARTGAAPRSTALPRATLGGAAPRRAPSRAATPAPRSYQAPVVTRAPRPSEPRASASASAPRVERALPRSTGEARGRLGSSASGGGARAQRSSGNNGSARRH